MQDQPPTHAAQVADRFYGVVLLALAVVSALAPMFAGAVLAWVLAIAGVSGLAWLLLDRTPRGFVAAAGWAIVALSLGLHLVLHALVEMGELALILTVGFVLLGGAEILFGVERYRRSRLARTLVVVAGAASIAFGLTITLVWPALPPWMASAVLSFMFGTLGAGLLIGSRHLARLGSTPTLKAGDNSLV